MISECYRQDYDGEFVILETKISQNAKKQTREWIPNTLINNHISSRAAVIGSDIDRKFFEWRRLSRHKGGLLASKKLQTYGSDELAAEMRFDFLVLTDEKLSDTVDTDNISVLTTAKICMSHPNRFHLIPYLPNLSKFALSLYLAAFDGHKEIFLIGYGNSMPVDIASWESDVKQIFDTYKNTQFYIVGRGGYPDSWRGCANLQDMSYKKFITYCDV